MHIGRRIVGSDSKKIFLITGAGTGLGRAFAEAALGAGQIVVGTVRRDDDRVAFEALHDKRARAVILDVTHFDSIAPAIRRIEALSTIPTPVVRIRLEDLL